MAVEHLHIKKVRVENYKSLRNTEIELKDGLNIIIGKNGAGKSNMLEFIYRYATAYPTNILKSIRSINSNLTISFGYKTTTNNTFTYSIDKLKSSSLKKNTHIYRITWDKIYGNKEIKDFKVFSFKEFENAQKFYEENKPLSEEFNIVGRIMSNLISFSIPKVLTWISDPTRIIMDKNSEGVFINDNRSESNFFDNFELNIDVSFALEVFREKNISADLIKELLVRLFSQYLESTSIGLFLKEYSIIGDIRISPNFNIYITGDKITIENIYIEFFIDNEWVPWSYLSDGTKRLFYLISECASFSEGVLLIEEPELGIHPHQLYKLLNFLKEQSREKQIIISTHSPLALDVLDEDELNRIVIAEYNNGTKFRRLTKAETAKAKRYMTEVGDLSYYWLHSDLEQ